MVTIKASSTDVSTYVIAVDDRTGQPKTGLIAGDISAGYARTRGAAVSISVSVLASPSAAHADGGFVEVDESAMPGLYRFDLPDAAVASGADQVTIMLTADDTIIAPLKASLTPAVISDLSTELHLCKAALVNKREHTISTGVDVIKDDDGTTTLVTLTPVDGGGDVIEVTPS